MKKVLASTALALLFVAPLIAQDQNAYPDQNQNQDQSDDPYAQGQGPMPQAPPPGPGQSQPPADSNQAAPGMARLSFIHGDVSTQRGDNGQWVAVTVNTPIAVGDRVSTGSGSRAEIQLDYANTIRMSDGTVVKVAGLSRENIQVQLGEGLATYAVLNGGEATAEIDTPNAAIHPNGPGDYRISVMPDGSTELVVLGGSAEVSEPQGSTQVDRGQMITIQGTDNPEYKISSAPAADAWDSWNNDRDHAIANAGSWRHTDRYYTGTQDLDQYGVWSEVPDYGPVWIPQQGPNWAPYSAGNWVWEPYWGWTWVSSEPWGWAPYHYGRWFVYGGNWAWWPGPVGVYSGYYPVWSPAYVSFFGWGGGIGFGIGFGFGWGFGHVGWLPCGPGDWFHPWWGGWGGHFNTFDIHNTTVINRNGFAPLGPRGEHSFSNVNEAFHNDRVRNGFSSMDSNRFGHGAVTGHGISANDFRSASMVSGKMPINPGRDSYSAANHAANPASYRNAPSSSQHFFSNSARGGTGFNAGSHSSFGANGVNNTARTQPLANRNTGTFNHGASNTNTFGRGGSSSVESGRPGWHSFTPPSGANQNHTSQGFGANNRSNPYDSSRSTAPYNSSRSTLGSSNTYRPPASAPRSGFSNSSPSYSRPPLNMRQPVVTPRGGFGGTQGGSHPSYTPRTFSAPRTPSYNAPRGGNGGGNHGGGGGGGSHPSGGGGGHSGGGGHGGKH